MQDTIKDLAYRLWQEAGCPEGTDMEHWLAAEAAVSQKPKAAKVDAAKAAKVDAPKVKAAKVDKPKAKTKASAKA
jgi:hypothetical protein